MKVRHFANKYKKTVVVVIAEFTLCVSTDKLGTLGVRTLSTEISENITVLVLAYLLNYGMQHLDSSIFFTRGMFNLLQRKWRLTIAS